MASCTASAVEQQASATREITRNTQQAAHGTDEVSRNNNGVSTAAADTGQAAKRVLSSSGELDHQTNALRARIDRFLAGIRAA